MTITAAEQLLLELINRARLDPLAEAARFGIDLNQGLTAGRIDSAPMQVLAHNSLLENAAVAHSQWMLDADTFGHTGAGGSDGQDRMADAGYVFGGSWNWGENLAMWGTTGSVNLNATIVEHYNGLFRSPGHRVNTLFDEFREIGIGQLQGGFTQGRTFNTSMLTETFAVSGTDVFVTGVSYRDGDGDGFYDIGEAIAGLAITAAGQTARTADAGGYGIGVDPGASVAVSIAQGATRLAALRLDLSTGNGKLDVVQQVSGGFTLALSASAVLESGIGVARLLGMAALNLTGHDGANDLHGNNAANRLAGAGGSDRIFGNGGADRLDDGAGADTLHGGAGNDTFVLAADGSADVIADFTRGQDRIDISAWAGATGLASIGQTAGANSVTLRFNAEVLTVTGTTALQAADLIFSTAPDLTQEPTRRSGDLIGTAGHDSLTGGGAADRAFGDAGRDTLLGGAGNDSLYGGAGDDTIDGGAGSDLLHGGLGHDRYVVTDSGDLVVGEVAYSRGGGIDTVLAWVSFTLPQSVEFLRLQGESRLSGTGGAAGEVLVGNAAANTLSGMGGADRINGGDGQDRITGGTGADLLAGGAGADVFVLTAAGESGVGEAARDMINGFERGLDRIDLSAIDAVPGRTGDQAFDAIGTAAFTGDAGQLRWQGWGGSYLVVSADLDGDAAADLQLFVTGTGWLTSTDFIL